MREIIFRAKAVNRERNSGRRTDYENGDWVYGLISKEYDERFPNLPAEMTDKAGVTGIEVDYQTIGEYTSLNDKYGIRIFEGDIVRVKTCWEDTPDYNALVLWINGAWCISEKYLILLNAVKDECEIIGIIYDNPELLEGEDNIGKA